MTYHDAMKLALNQQIKTYNDEQSGAKKLLQNKEISKAEYMTRGERSKSKKTAIQDLYTRSISIHNDSIE